MTRRRLALLLAAGLVVGGATGCGGDEDEGSSVDPAATELTTEAAANGAEPSPLAAVQQELENAGFKVQNSNTSDVEDAIEVDGEFHVLLHASPVEAKASGAQLESIVGDKGAVEVRDDLVFWFGEESAASADQQAAFEEIVTVATK